MAEDRGQERYPAELVHGGGRVRGHGRRARDGAQQRDLPHSFTASAPAQELPVLARVEFTRGDGIVGIAHVALPDQHGAGRQVHRGQRRRQALDRRGGQLGEQRQRAEQGDLDDWHGSAGVENE